MSEIFDTIILGGGPGGMSAGIYCARGNLKTAVIDTSMFGGAPTNYLEIENYPGLGILEGWELGEKFEQHLDKFNVHKFPNTEIRKVDLLSDIKTVTTIDNKEFMAKTIIIATGASPQKLGVRGEAENIGHGVSYCAVCDAAFYRGKTVTVVGGGNTAVEEACYLTKFAQKVYIIHRRDELRADKILQERAFTNPKVEFVWDSVVEEILSEGKVNGVLIKNVKTGNILTLPVDGVFPYIGLIPNVGLFSGQLEQDRRGFIVTDNTMRTSVFGVYAIGDVRTTPLRQVITAVSDGAIAGVSAAKYLQEVQKEITV
jgi:thioredoxin reductase (NADPH)